MLFSRLKAVALGVVLFAYGALSLFVAILLPQPRTRRRSHAWLTHLCSRFLVRILGIEVVIQGDTSLSGVDSGSLLLANHQSYLDAVVLSWLAPSLFVTSMEVSQTPGLGALARCAGSLFIERRNRNTLLRDLETLRQTLGDGLPVIVFPEGTTGNGERVLPFKKSLLAAAVECGAEVVPICLNYRALDARPVTAINRDSLFWYGEMTFLPHLMRVLRLRSIVVEVTILSRLSSRVSSRKQIAERAFDSISASFVPVL